MEDRYNVMNAQIESYIKDKGVVIGMDVINLTDTTILDLAIALGKNKSIIRKSAATQYLRIDKNAPDSVRISPSFIRDFLSYTCFGFDEESVIRKVSELKEKHLNISKYKKEFVKRLAIDIYEEFKSDLIEFGTLVAGDIVYGMAHEEPRREISTELLVKGSDIDVVVFIDQKSLNIKEKIEKKILQHKYYLLKNPQIQEELDFVIKTKYDMENQLNFDNIKNMIATKVFIEGDIVFQHGEVIDECRKSDKAIEMSKKLSELESIAKIRQENLTNSIYNGYIEHICDMKSSLFYSAELDEFGEFCFTSKKLFEILK